MGKLIHVLFSDAVCRGGGGGEEGGGGREILLFIHYFGSKELFNVE